MAAPTLVRAVGRLFLKVITILCANCVTYVYQQPTHDTWLERTLQTRVET